MLEVSERHIRRFFEELELEQSKDALYIEYPEERIGECKTNAPRVKYRRSRNEDELII
jgi:hypothetical protein